MLGRRCPIQEADIARDPEQPPAISPLYPRWATRAFRLALVLGALCVLAIPASLWAWERTPYVSGVGEQRAQPVKFDHRHHVRDDGIACLYCHSDAFRSSSAGMPAVSVCMGCHAQIWTESRELEPVRAAYFSDAPLAWQRVTRLPHYVFFDHSVHVTRGVGCASCHGRVDGMAEVVAAKPFTMDFCLDCHRSPGAALRPLAEITSMGWQAPSAQPEYGERLRAAYDVHPGTDCTDCHR